MKIDKLSKTLTKDVLKSLTENVIKEIPFYIRTELECSLEQIQMSLYDDIAHTFLYSKSTIIDIDIHKGEVCLCISDGGIATQKYIPLKKLLKTFLENAGQYEASPQCFLKAQKLLTVAAKKLDKVIARQKETLK